MSLIPESDLAQPPRVEPPADDWVPRIYCDPATADWWPAEQGVTQRWSEEADDWIGHGIGPSDVWRVAESRLPGPWPFQPDTCPYDALLGVWTRDGHDLFCPGCGTNGT